MSASLNEIINEDVKNIGSLNLPFEEMKDKTVLVTGATGLIGAMSVRTLCGLSKAKNLNLKVIAMSRSNKRAKEAIGPDGDFEGLVYVEQDITEMLDYDGGVDYIIHTACPTKSSFFVNNPVETISAIVDGTKNILELARNKKTKSVVYLSSMEVYGQILHENYLKAEDQGYVNPVSLRSSYPQGKRLAELLSVSYSFEYEVPVKIVRLAQTFGPGIPENDNRVFAQFIHSALEGKDIVMFTEGGSKRMYLDTMDAVSAIFYVLLCGKNGEIYNAGNEANYSSIRDMAELVIREFGNGSNKVTIDRSKDVGQYPPDNMLRLDTKPLRSLGWEAKYDLKAMYVRMLSK